jgi:hypothetical protein
MGNITKINDTEHKIALNISCYMEVVKMTAYHNDKLHSRKFPRK